MEYAVKVIPDTELTGVDEDYLFVRLPGCLQCWIRESVTKQPDRLEQALEGAWATFLSIHDGSLMSWPEAETVN